ncbi:MAG: UDP-2,3-diacylglucosamine diphosphatase [Gammaproteobacteria bacterium]
MPVLFISDLHLCAVRPGKLDLFTSLLRGPARKAEALYILGDLFEAWAGDDDRTPPHPEVTAELAGFTRAGGRLYLLRGNRDYLLGGEFARATGGQLLADETTILLQGRKVLLMHGDTLCTRDVKYQLYRRLVNNRYAIRLFLRVPFSIRKNIWHGVRNFTRRTTARKPPYLIDVHQAAVEKTMRRHEVQDLIHGHTHRQGVHEFSLDGLPARRYVLGDWYESDCVLVADENGLRMWRVQDYLNNFGAARG